MKHRKEGKKEKKRKKKKKRKKRKEKQERDKKPFSKTRNMPPDLLRTDPQPIIHNWGLADRCIIGAVPGKSSWVECCGNMSGKKIIVKLPGITWQDLQNKREEKRPTTIKKMVLAPTPRVKKRRLEEGAEEGEAAVAQAVAEEGEERKGSIVVKLGAKKSQLEQMMESGEEDDEEDEKVRASARLHGISKETLKRIHDTSGFDRVGGVAELEEAEKRDAIAYWSPYETDKLYDAFRVFGADFTLMEAKFANRNRLQLKSKFNLEEKDNDEAITWALANEFEVPDEIDPFALPLPCQLRGWSQDELKKYYPVLLKHLEAKYGTRPDP
jgi:hypothetical protein